MTNQVTLPSHTPLTAITPQDGQAFQLTLSFKNGATTNFNFPLNPEELQLQMPSRVTTVNTIAGAYQDNWGPGVGRLTISGTTGWRGRLASQLVLPAPSGGVSATFDGYLYFLVMRDIHVAFQNFCAENDPSDADMELVLPPFGNGTPISGPQAGTIALNSDQFGNYRVSSDNFTVLRSKAQPMLFRYQWDMTILKDNLQKTQVDPSIRFVILPGSFSSDPLQLGTGGSGITTSGLTTAPSTPLNAPPPSASDHSQAGKTAKNEAGPLPTPVPNLIAIPMPNGLSTDQQNVIVQNAIQHTTAGGLPLTFDEVQQFAAAYGYGATLFTLNNQATSAYGFYQPTEAWLAAYRQLVPNPFSVTNPAPSN